VVAFDAVADAPTMLYRYGTDLNVDPVVGTLQDMGGRAYAFQMIVASGDASEVGLDSRIQSSPLPLTAGSSTTVVVSSTLDGTYRFTLRRASLSSIALLLTTSAPSATIDQSSLVTPLGYLPTASTYSATVSYLYVSAALNLTFVTGGSITIGGVVCTSGQPCGNATLVVGSNVIGIASTWEGVITYYLTRAAPAVAFLQVTCFDADTSTQIVQVLSPLFAVGTLVYSLSVAYYFSTCLIAATYSVSDSVSYSATGYAATPSSGSATLGYAPALTSPSYAILAGGMTTLQAVSMLDGAYSVSVCRAPPVITSVSFAAASGSPLLTPAYAPAFDSSNYGTYTSVMLPYADATVAVAVAATGGALYYSLSGAALTPGAGLNVTTLVDGSGSFARIPRWI
jgi:hypothetical protein